MINVSIYSFQIAADVFDFDRYIVKVGCTNEYNPRIISCFVYTFEPTSTV